MKCPVCNNKSKNTHKCEICKWEFINFTESPTEDEYNEYLKKLAQYKSAFFGNAIKKVTPKDFEIGRFETSKEYANRIKNFSFVQIGTILWEDYIPDDKKLKFKVNVNRNLSGIDFYNKPHIIMYEIDLEPVQAEELYKNQPIPLIVSLEIIDSHITLIDMKVDRYSFIKEHNEYIQSLKNKKEAEEKENLEEEQYIKLRQLQKEKQLKTADIERDKKRKKENSLVNKFSKNIKAYISERI